MQIISKNKINISLLDECFYKSLFNEIFNNKNQKEKTLNENSSGLCEIQFR